MPKPQFHSPGLVFLSAMITDAPDAHVPQARAILPLPGPALVHTAPRPQAPHRSSFASAGEARTAARGPRPSTRSRTAA